MTHTLMLITVSFSAVHAPIPPIFDSIVASISKPSRDLSPPASHVRNHLLNHISFLVRDRLMVKRLLQILMISFTTLLWRPMLHVLRDAHPIVGTLLLNQIKESLILVSGPWSTTSGRSCHRSVVWLYCLPMTPKSHHEPRASTKAKWSTTIRRQLDDLRCVMRY